MTLPELARFRQTGRVSTSDGLDEIADRLYALPPADFVAARDEEVAAARSAGDRPRATAIGKLRRPTVAAWLVNLLALERPDELGELLELGEELRAAQHQLRGSELRELATRRRAAVHGLVQQACDLAVEAGSQRSSLPVAEVETTLVAALADEGLGEAVRAGRLLKSGTYDGFGETPRPQFEVIPGGAADEDRAPKPVRKKADKPAVKVAPEAPSRRAQAADADRAKARVRLDEATAGMEAAEAAYQEAVEAVEARSREVTDIEERLTQLRRERVAAHAALLEAQSTQDSADADRHAAQRGLAAAERAAKRSND
ncbi:MAG TPA: hypothetical protein VGJ28_06335 [Micromonosporaceae bacterium]